MALDVPVGDGGNGDPVLDETLRGLREMMAGLETAVPVAAFAGDLADLTLPTRAGTVTARSYRPAGLASPAPAFVFFHGGGFVAGSIASHDNICRELATDAGAVVVSVEYRLAPEHPYPAAVHDAIDATAWVAANAAALDIDPTRLGVAGDSAGAALATAVALDARHGHGPVLAGQLLAYPKIDFVTDHPSHHEPVGAMGIRPELAALFDRAYLPDPAQRSEPLASPLVAEDLTGLPPTLIVSAERDTLRDEAELYGRRLHKAGVTVATMRAVGLLHGFLNMTTIQPAGRLFARSVYVAAGQLLMKGPS